MTTEIHSKSTKDIKQRDLITSLERGLRVLRVFDRNAVEMTPAEVARKTALPRAATRRILLTLCELGYAVSDGKHFRLAPKVLDLAHGYLAKTRVRDMIEPILSQTVDTVKESCTLNIRDGADSISITCCNSNTFGAVNMAVGLRIPLYISTPGRLMLASLSNKELTDYLAKTKLTRFTSHSITSKAALRTELLRIKEEGYSIGREEWELGVYALSVPVMVKGSSQIVAALTCVGNVARIQAANAISSRLAILRRAASQIGALLPDTPDFTEELQLTAKGNSSSY